MYSLSEGLRVVHLLIRCRGNADGSPLELIISDDRVEPSNDLP